MRNGLYLCIALILWIGSAAASDLIIEERAIGSGPMAETGTLVAIHYTGWLGDGTKLDSSIDRGRPAQFTLGQGQVIAGWDQGILGMKVGGKRRLVVPPGLAYGNRGAGQAIPPDATLVFEIELLQVQALNYQRIGNDGLKALLTKGVPVIDIRRPEEWRQTGVIPGAIRLTAYDHQGRLNPDFLPALREHIQPNDPVILICRTGGRSTRLAQFLSAEDQGFSAVYNHRGGMMRWLMFRGAVAPCCS